MTAQEYQQALHRINELMRQDPDPESFNARELDALVAAVMVYEERIYPIARVLSGTR